ncbi:paraquat-inducible protein A [Rhizobium sp. CECT 9324]|uniref:paraquat-inducible protein A n=1 Tax=Rhizobium sp. CECT 9324 TaxID=2845820 RepID=UPI001E5F2B5A|nr:paraquat-inducible protein A [Rhizobium sp. CECT 9324]
MNVSVAALMDPEYHRPVPRDNCQTGARSVHTWRRIFVLIWLKSSLLILAPGFLALGISLPLMRFESLYVFSEEPSLITIIASLWQGGDVLLSVIVGLVSVVFPWIKLIGLAAEHLNCVERQAGGWVEKLVPVLSRWSMMDVLLVALVIFAAKTTGLAQAFSQPGLWFYAGSVVLAAVLHRLPARRTISGAVTQKR